MILTDTHCHIHDPSFFPDGGENDYEQALQVGVHRMICVGTDIESSKMALQFAEKHPAAYASFGIHPHDSAKELPQFDAFAEWALSHNTEKVVAVGEIGLDYHYMNSPREVQLGLLEKQINLAQKMNVPVIFHVRDAFDDFWPVFRNFSGVRGVLHSFTDSLENMEKGLENGLYIGVNGIVTFAKGRDDVTKAIPLENIVLETDAPYLTPNPIRGKINAPGNVVYIASYVAALRGITVEELSRGTEANVARLFFQNTK